MPAPSPLSLREAQLLAAQIAAKPTVYRSELEGAILAICRERFYSLKQLAGFFGRKSVTKFRDNYITRMVKDGRLVRKYPEVPAHHDQQYMTAP
jgi:hypothetical protein